MPVHVAAPTSSASGAEALVLFLLGEWSRQRREIDLRMTKLHEKISGSWRSMEGARAFLAVRSYLATARKQGRGMLEVLIAAFEGRPWLPAAGP